MAATMRIMSVMSCRASHASRRKLFGGRGGMTLAPNTSARWRRSSGDPLRPVDRTQCAHTVVPHSNNTLKAQWPRPLGGQAQP